MSADRTDRLTDSQRSYLRLVLAHKSSKEIAQDFGISAHTVDKRIKEAMRVLGVSTRVEAARILAAEDAAGPGPKLGPQSPDLAIPTSRPSVGPENVEGDGGDGRAASASRRETLDEGAGGRGLPLPFPTRTRPENNLSILQRLGWTLGLIIGLAVATGILLSGLSSITTLLMALAR